MGWSKVNSHSPSSQCVLPPFVPTQDCQPLNKPSVSRQRFTSCNAIPLVTTACHRTCCAVHVSCTMQHWDMYLYNVLAHGNVHAPSPRGFAGRLHLLVVTVTSDSWYTLHRATNLLWTRDQMLQGQPGSQRKNCTVWRLALGLFNGCRYWVGAKGGRTHWLEGEWEFILDLPMKTPGRSGLAWKAGFQSLRSGATSDLKWQKSLSPDDDQSSSDRNAEEKLEIVWTTPCYTWLALCKMSLERISHLYLRKSDNVKCTKLSANFGGAEEVDINTLNSIASPVYCTQSRSYG